jgi:hypothetical protein
MIQKRKMLRQLNKLRKELRRTEMLMDQASVASKDLMAIQQESRVLMTEARLIRSSGKNPK